MFDLFSTLFYLFSALLMYAGVRVITAKNPVHAALHLMLIFFNCAGIWLLLQAEFLALVLIMVYVGAVMVLILFVVMMLDLEQSFLVNNLKKNYPVAILMGIVLVLDLCVAILRGYSERYPSPPEKLLEQVGTTRSLGLSLFREHLFSVEVAATILLTALIAAVALTLQKRKNVRGIAVSSQLAARKEDRMKLVRGMGVVGVASQNNNDAHNNEPNTPAA